MFISVNNNRDIDGCLGFTVLFLNCVCVLQSGTLEMKNNFLIEVSRVRSRLEFTENKVGICLQGEFVVLFSAKYLCLALNVFRIMCKV